MKSIIKNIGLQTIYQILATITPLVTSPYLSRVLGAEGLGVYSYTYSIVSYFVLFAMLGITNYGSRAIAMAKNPEEERRFFWEIHGLQIISTGVMSIAYLILLCTALQENRIVSGIQIFWLLSCCIDVNWFFFGKEDFKATVSRNIIFKILTVIALFVFVHSPEDVWVYTFIMAFGNLIGQSALYVVLLSRIKFVKPTFARLLYHLKPNIVLFIPILAVSVYSVMDKTMLGMFSDNWESGYYYNADKVIWIPLSIISGIGTVMLPKVSAMRAEERNTETRQLLGISINVFTCFAIAMAFGLAAIAAEFVPLFFGQGYDTCVSLIIMMAPVMIFTTLSNVMRTQYLIPYNKEKIYIIAVAVGAAVNFAINLTLIGVKDMGALGATIGTVIAGFIVCLIEFIMVEKELGLFKELGRLVPYLLFGAVMFCCVRAVSTISSNTFIQLIVEIATGCFVYLLLVISYLALTKKHMLKSLIVKLKGEDTL